MKSKAKKQTGGIINRHHVFYPSEQHPEQEWVEAIRKGEHRCLTLMSFYTSKHVSKGFLKCLKLFILRNEDRAEDLSQEG